MDKKGKKDSLPNSQKTIPINSITIQKIYIINVPKLIKFTYRANNPDIVSSPPNRQLHKELFSSMSKKSKISTKIKVVSKKETNISNIQLEDGFNKSQYQTQKKNKIVRKLKTLCSSETKHRVTKSIVQTNPFVSCSFFSECEDGNYQYQPLTIKKAESRALVKLQLSPQVQISTMKQDQMRKTSKSRKKIFDQSRLNNSFLNQSINEHSRSKSRNSIFSPYKLNNRSRSLSQNLSFYRKNRIFSPLKILRKQVQQTIKEEEIPSLILQSWKSKDRSTSESNNQYNETSQ